MNSKRYGSMPIRLLAIVATIALLFAACGGDDSGANFDEIGLEIGGSDGGEANRDRPATTAAAAATTAAPGGGDVADAREVLGTGGVEPLAQPADFGRDIIYTADLTIAVTDVAAAGQEATRIMGEFGGLLFGQQTEGLPNPRSVLIFKVQPEDFQAALAALGAIGEVRTQNVTADDVTDRVVDLESRRTTLETSIARLQGFLEDATDIKTIAQLEGQLVERETALEQIRGQLRTLQDRIALATITVTLTEAFADPNVRLITTAYVGDDAGAACPGSENLAIEEGQQFNLCFEIRNNGDTVLTDFTLRDSVLDLSIDDLTTIDGDPKGTLQPGQSMILATTADIARRTRTQTTVTAVPVNDDGTAIETRTVSSAGAVLVTIDEPDGLPGFDDGLRVATDVLQWLGGMIVIAAGLAVPFLWVIPLVGLWWWRRGVRRKRREEELAEKFPGAPTPSPAIAEDAAEKAPRGDETDAAEASEDVAPDNA